MEPLKPEFTFNVNENLRNEIIKFNPGQWLLVNKNTNKAANKCFSEFNELLAKTLPFLKIHVQLRRGQDKPVELFIQLVKRLYKTNEAFGCLVQAPSSSDRLELEANQFRNLLDNVNIKMKNQSSAKLKDFSALNRQILDECPFLQTMFEEIKEKIDPNPLNRFVKLVISLHEVASVLNCDIKMPPTLDPLEWEMNNFKKLVDHVNAAMKNQKIALEPNADEIKWIDSLSLDLIYEHWDLLNKQRIAYISPDLVGKILNLLRQGAL